MSGPLTGSRVIELAGIGPVPRFSAHPDAVPGVPHAPGAHTRDVLTEAGLDAAESIAANIAIEAG